MGVLQHVGAGFAQGQLDVIDAGLLDSHLLHGVADDVPGHWDRLLVPWQGEGQREFHAEVVPFEAGTDTWCSPHAVA